MDDDARSAAGVSPRWEPEEADLNGKLLIDGEWREAESGERLEVYDPGRGVVIGGAAAGDAGDVDAAVAAARRAFDTGRWTAIPRPERARILWRIADLVEADARAFGTLESLNQGMPARGAIEKTVPEVAQCFRYFAGWVE